MKVHYPQRMQTKPAANRLPEPDPIAQFIYEVDGSHYKVEFQPFTDFWCVTFDGVPVRQRWRRNPPYVLSYTYNRMVYETELSARARARLLNADYETDRFGWKRIQLLEEK